ncbi:MAG: hypothetical protein ACI8ZB_001511 [Desulforhopalus sp.]|jgi:hypothetical protein
MKRRKLMLEYFFKDQAVAKRLKQSVLGSQIDTFVSVVYDLGYASETTGSFAGNTIWCQTGSI